MYNKKCTQSIRLLATIRHIVSFIILLWNLKSPPEKKSISTSLINEETTTQERKAQHSTSPLFSTLSGDRLLLAGILLLIRSEFCQSNPIRSCPVRSGPIQILPRALIVHPQFNIHMIHNFHMLFRMLIISISLIPNQSIGGKY